MSSAAQAAVHDAETRLAQFEIIAGNWLGVDEAAAKAWITSSSLPKEVKERLLHPNDAPPVPAAPSIR